MSAWRTQVSWKNTHYYIFPQSYPTLPYGYGILDVPFCNIAFIVTRCLAMCLGLPRFTGPTNKIKLESAWGHTFDEITICKRNKRLVPEGGKPKCCLPRLKAQTPRTFKNWAQYAKEICNVWANSRGYQNKLYLYMTYTALFLGAGERSDCVSDENSEPLLVYKPTGVVLVKPHLGEIWFLMHFHILARLILADAS